MGNDLKETPYAPATEAEISELPTGQAAQSSEDSDAPRDRLSSLQEPPPRSSRLPDLRDLPGPGSNRDASPGTRQLASPDVAANLITLRGPVVQGRAFVFPGQGDKAGVWTDTPQARQAYRAMAQQFGEFHARQPLEA